MIIQKNFEQNILISKIAASEGMVLLKNDGILPLKPTDNISFIGSGCFSYQKGGTGSANVKCAYVVNIIDGLAAKKGKININERSVCSGNVPCPSTNALNELAKESNIAIVAVSRQAGEGRDRKAEKGDFYLSDDEQNILENIESSNFKAAVVILNIGGMINIRQIIQYSKVKAVLLIWQPGMEGGNAVADILCGDINPSGKLTDTIANDYEDYPSSKFFGKSLNTVYYAEDIYVGYRYFETFAGDKVLYPFGYGLSYTSFDITPINFRADEGEVKITVNVKNTGNMCGKEIVQIYSVPCGGIAPKPATELRAFAKTNMIHPQENCDLALSFKISDMAYFDENQAAYILDKGTYKIYAGSDIRNRIFCGEVTIDAPQTVFKTKLKTVGGMPYKMNEQGIFAETVCFDGTRDHASNHTDRKIPDNYDKSINLYDVSDGKITLDEFVKNLTPEQLIDLAQAQPPAFPKGTAGIGNIDDLGIPNPQTADGPAGLRKSVDTTCFPCASLLACSWNEELLQKVGSAIGFEGINTNVDILLAPGLNIHRNPLCGRNFEYYSEDPLISGKCASAMVKGVQSTGLGATIKHFALNNCESNRHNSNSVVSERALREIYIKGFEIAIKESEPWCVMTSYNIINGTRASANNGLLNGILRDEWNYKGAVMTDWRVESHLWQELICGNNIKMPYGYPEELELAKLKYKWGIISRDTLETNAKYILTLIMKTKAFKDKNFGIIHDIKNGTVINALDFQNVSFTMADSGSFENNENYLSNLGLDQRGNESFVCYKIYAENDLETAIKIKTACAYKGLSAQILIDDETYDRISLDLPEFDLSKPFWSAGKPLCIPKGSHTLKIRICDPKDSNCINISKIAFA